MSIFIIFFIIIIYIADHTTSVACSVCRCVCVRTHVYIIRVLIGCSQLGHTHICLDCFADCRSDEFLQKQKHHPPPTADSELPLCSSPARNIRRTEFFAYAQNYVLRLYPRQYGIVCLTERKFMKAIILSDLHIEDKSRWSKSDTNEDLDYLIEQIKAMPKDRFDVDCIIVCGDTTSRPRENAATVSNLRKLFEAVNPLNKPVYVINGNHDSGEDNYLTTVCNCIRVPDNVCTIADKVVAFHDYSNNLDTIREFLTKPEPDIFVIHQSSQPFIDIPIEDLPVMKVEDYPANKICIIGDTHIPAIYKDEDNRLLLSPGTLYPHIKTDMAIASYLIFMDTDNLSNPFNPIHLEKRSGIALESSKSLDMIKESVEEFLASDRPLKPVIWLPSFAKDSFINDDRAIFIQYTTYQDSSGEVVTVTDDQPIGEILAALIDAVNPPTEEVRQAVFNKAMEYHLADDPKDVPLD